MPRTGFKKSSSLSIELDGDLSTHCPGDTLTGYVVVEKPPRKQSPFGSAVRIKLFGRVKTKYKKKTSNGTSITRGRAVLFEQSCLVSKSAVCHNGEHAWPFSIEIPKSSQPGFAVRGDEFKPEPLQGYLHTKGEYKKEVDVSKHALPSVLYYFSESALSGKTVEAYIEYVLVATCGESTAYHPIHVRRSSVPSPITNYKMRICLHYTPNVIKTLKLLPEHADRKLTFGQKSGRFFRPGKTPKYTYSVKVEHPQVIQLEHPDPIPLKVHIVPDLDPRKTTICPNNDISTLPPVQVISIEMELKADFGIRCPGTLWDTDTVKNHTFPFSFPVAIKPVTIPVIQASAKPSDLKHVSSAPEQPSEPPPPVPETAPPMLGATLTTPFSMLDNASLMSEATTAVPEPEIALPHVATAPLANTKVIADALSVSKAPKPLNLGAYLSILLGCSAASTCGQRAFSFKRQVYPTFATYNIFLRYRLQWKITTICADEKKSVSGDYPVVVLAPSEEQESQKKRELGTQGMKKNYDDMEQGFGVAAQVIGGILQVVT